MAIGTTAAGIYGGLTILNQLLALRNQFKNSGRDPNQLVTEDTIRQRVMTPEQGQLRRNELNQAIQMLTQPRRIYNNRNMQYIPGANPNVDTNIDQNINQQPLGGLARRLLNIERSNMVGGLGSDYSQLESSLVNLDPLGAQASGRQALRGQAFKGRFNRTLVDQMRMLSDFSTQNYLNTLEGQRLNRLKEQIQNQLQQEGGVLGRESQGLGQAGYMSQRVLGARETDLLNEAENQRLGMGNRKYQYGLTPNYRYQQAPPLLK